MSEYFGKGCKHLMGKWERDDINKESAPLINCCKHFNNTNIYEGSCNKADCPKGSINN